MYKYLIKNFQYLNKLIFPNIKKFWENFEKWPPGAIRGPVQAADQKMFKIFWKSLFFQKLDNFEQFFQNFEN